ncbi:hypothetical protein [Streptomyces sp. NPDC127103]|uniref:hypothetical protein n=1 Tax=Streptomyces sp. NPDC127103 TaxID=3347139 RepID=UPI00365AEB14
MTLATVEAGDANLVKATMAHAGVLLGRIAKPSVKALGPLSARAKWAVAGLRRSDD